MFYYLEICNHTCDRRLKHSAQAEAKIVSLLYHHYIPSRPAIKPQDWRAMSLISLNSMFHSPIPLIIPLPRT